MHGFTQSSIGMVALFCGIHGFYLPKDIIHVVHGCYQIGVVPFIMDTCHPWMISMGFIMLI